MSSTAADLKRVNPKGVNHNALAESRQLTKVVVRPVPGEGWSYLRGLVAGIPLLERHEEMAQPLNANHETLTKILTPIPCTL